MEQLHAMLEIDAPHPFTTLNVHWFMVLGATRVQWEAEMVPEKIPQG